MRRKLVRQGKNALTVTLPSKWAKAHNLNPGDEVEVIESDENLNIGPNIDQTIKDITLDVSNLTPRLADRFMARAYQKGYDKITVKFNKPDIMLAVKEKIPELMGFELMDIGKNKMDIQVVSTNLNLNFDVLLRRAFLILMDMAQICHDAYEKKDNDKLENIVKQDLEVNRFTYFCLRDLNKNQKVMTFGRSILYYLIESLEDLGDDLKKLGSSLAKMRDDKEMLSILKKLNELFRTSYEFFYSPTADKAVASYELGKELDVMVEEKLGSGGKNSTKALFLISTSCNIIKHLVTMRLDTLQDETLEKPPTTI